MTATATPTQGQLNDILDDEAFCQKIESELPDYHACCWDDACSGILTLQGSWVLYRDGVREMLKNHIGFDIFELLYRFFEERDIEALHSCCDRFSWAESYLHGIRDLIKKQEWDAAKSGDDIGSSDL